MSQTTLLVGATIAVAIAVGAGVFGYSYDSDETADKQPDYLRAYQISLEKRCLSTLRRAGRNQPMLYLVLKYKIVAGCACTAGVLRGMTKNEAKLVSTTLPAKIDFELAKDIRRRALKEAKSGQNSRNGKALVAKRAKRAKKKAEKVFIREVKKALAKSGLGPKNALTLLKGAEKDWKRCLRSPKSSS